MELAWISSIFIPGYPLLPSPDISRRSLDGAKGSGDAKVKIASCLGVRFKRNSYIPGEFGERLFREEEDGRGRVHSHFVAVNEKLDNECGKSFVNVIGKSALNIRDNCY